MGGHPVYIFPKITKNSDLQMIFSMNGKTVMTMRLLEIILRYGKYLPPPILIPLELFYIIKPLFSDLLNPLCLSLNPNSL